MPFLENTINWMIYRITVIAAVQLSRNCIGVESATDAYTATKTRIISTDIENEK